MNNLLSQITPLTRGIIWFPKIDSFESNSNYKEIDYLLNGLLTRNINYSFDFTSKLILGKNFKSSLYVMIIKEIRESEIQSFVSLIKRDLLPGTDVAIIDELNHYHKIKNDLKEISSYLKLLNITHNT
jgi:hypothetical protein